MKKRTTYLAAVAAVLLASLVAESPVAAGHELDIASNAVTLGQPYKVSEKDYITETRAEDVEAAVTPVTFDECTAFTSMPTEPYWFKDRFNACFSGNIEYIYYEYILGVETEVGRSIFRLDFIGTGLNQLNEVQFGVRLVHIEDRGKVSKDDNRLAITLDCGNGDANRDSTCTVPSNIVEKTVQQWEDEGASSPISFVATGTTAAVPANDKYKAENRGIFNFTLKLTSKDPSERTRSSQLPDEKFRCDSVVDTGYVTGSHCVFNRVVSSLVLDSTSTQYMDSALFIRDAQNDLPALTKPGVAEKRVAGRKDKQEPLHRLWKGYDDGNKIAGSRRKVRSACRFFFGVNYTKGQNNTKFDCDEYPFATTYENAAKVDEASPWSYAVKALNASHNRSAGAIYGQFLIRDHILDNDAFYVEVR